MSGATGPSDEAVRVLHEEAQGHLEAVVAQIHEVDDKTAALVRFNAVIVGVVATGLSVAVRSAGGIIHPGWGVGILASGLNALVFSTLEGIRSYLKPSVEVGVDPDGLVAALDLDMDESDVRGEVVRAYRQGVKRNILALEYTLSRFQRMLYALMLGLVLLAAGALVLLLLGGN